jgi:hypothetical protein
MMAAVVVLALVTTTGVRTVGLGVKAAAPKWDGLTDSGPLGRAADALFMARFRSKLAEEFGRDSREPAASYAGIVELIVGLHEREGGQAPELVEGASRRVLRSLFPNWPPLNPEGTVGLLHWFGVLFARPFPVFSARLNAWVTWLAAQWLMGRCELRDLSEPADLARLAVGDGKGQLLHVCRCRYLEETRCASICVNTCKMPTQAFFNKDMGVPMTIEPDYETLECRFKFGVPPSAANELDARRVACFEQCPSRAGRALAPQAKTVARCARMG